MAGRIRLLGACAALLGQSSRKMGACLLAVLAALPARGASVQLGAAHDTSIFQNHTDRSDGGGPAFFAGTDGNNSPRRALISFDFGGIPSGATVTNVQLTLTLAQVPQGGTTTTISLFELQHAWGEGVAGSGAMGTDATGQGFPANPGDATWSQSFFGAIPWLAAGGDHAGASSATLFLNDNTLGTAFTWLSTPDLVADVQGWLDHPATNFGWEMINADELNARSLFGFYSSDWSNLVGSNPSQEPMLQVTYTVPEPAALALRLAMLPLAFWRRRSYLRRS